MSALLKIPKLLGAFILCLVLLIAAAFAAVQTRAAKDWLAGLATRALSGPGMAVRVGTIDGTVPFDMHLSELRLADADGAFLVAENLALAVEPRALLRGRVEIARLSAEDIAVARLPDTKSPATSQPMNPLQLLHPPVAVVLDELTIGRVRLAAPVLGEAVALSVDGSTSLVGGEASARLTVQRIDGPPGQADLSLALTGQPARLKVAFDIAEPSGLLLNRLLGRADGLPLVVSLAGDAPLADWHGTLAASAGDLARLNADLMIADSPSYRVSARGALAALPLLPPDLAPVLGDNVGFEVQLRGAGEGSVVLERLSLGMAAATLAVTGRYDGRDSTLSAEATLAAPDVAPFSSLAGASLAGAGELRLRTSGTIQRPQVELALELRELRAERNGIDRGHAEFHVVTDGDIGRPETRWAITGEGRIENLMRAAGAVPAGLGVILEWHLAGSTNATADSVDIQAFRATTTGLVLTASAAIRGHGATIDGNASLEVADLSQFSELAGQTLRGSGRLDLAARTIADGTVAATLSGGLMALSLGDAADALLGGRLQIDCAARRSQDGRVVLEKLDFAGANGTLSAMGEFSAERRLSAALKLEVPAIGVLAAPLGIQMAGRVGLQANVEGPLDAPGGKAILDGEGIVVGQGKLDRLHATLAFATATAGGRLDGTFRAGKLDGILGGEFALRQDNTVLDLANLHLTAPGTTLDGAIRLALDTGLANGTLKGRVADLAPWSQLTGMKLAGRADLATTLASKTGQSVGLSLTGGGIRASSNGGAGIAVERIAASARLDDVRGKPSGHATIELGRSDMGVAKISALSLKLDSVKPGRFTFNGEARGKVHQKFALATAGDVELANDGATLHLSRLAGDVAGEPVQLGQTLTVSRKGADLTVANLALTLGAGKIAGNLSRRGERLTLALKGGRVPIGLAAKLAGHEHASGTLSFDADLSGTGTRPQGRLILDVRDLRLADASRSDLPPLGITADAVWRGGRVETKGRIAGPKSEAIGFAGSLPVELVPGSFAVTLPPQGAVAFKLEGNGEIADLEDLLPLGEDRVAGAFSLDANVTGTVAQPRAGGALRITAGRYESMAAGTVLQDIALELVGDRERFVLRSFHATDGESGKMDAQGSVDLSASPGPAIDAAVKLASFRVLRLDEANIRAGGDVQLGGLLTALRIGARLRVDQGELRPPDRLPPSVTDLDIIEINSATGERLTPPRQTEREPVLPAVLDISVEIPGQVFVRGHGLDSEWRGKLTVSGTSAQPIIVGTLELVRGVFSLLGKNFTLTHGAIHFDGGPKIDPTLDITTEASSADITATVTIGGTASAPTVKIGSVPEMPQDEVLARILFGKSVGKITPAQGLQVAAAVASLAGGGPGLLDKMRSALGLDRFDFGSATDNTTGNASSNATRSRLGGATVSGGKYIAEGVYVGVDQGAGTGTSKGKVEIEIAPNLSVETNVGVGGGNGLGLNWQMDY
jgi:translocation and assembly module TamB